MPVSSSKKLKMLLVEGNRMELEKTSMQLENYFTREKCTISKAASGKEALEIIENDTPDIVLLDYYLTDIKGDELLKLVKKDFPFLPVIILTFIGSADIAVKLMKLGADDYVSKKYGFLGIGSVIEKVIQNKETEAEVARLKNQLNEELKSRNEKLEKMADSAIQQLRERNFKISRILEVGRTMFTQKDLDTLLTTMIHEISDILEAERASLFIYDEKTEELWLRCAGKSELDEIRFSIKKGIAGQVARNKKLVNVKNAYKDKAFNTEIDLETGFKTINLLCAPMENLQGKLIGVIEVLNKDAMSFSREDEEVLTMFASLAAVLIENSILGKENIKRERLATVGNMASTIIHDINSPMTTIRGFAEIINKQSPKNKEFTGIIMRSADRILNMTQELLEFAQGGEKAPAFEKINCELFFKEIFSIITRDLKEKSINFVSSVQYKGEMQINADKIGRAVYNIMGNALDAMENGDKFTIKVKESGNKKNVVISFVDSGKGMPEKIRKTLFEAFVTHGKKEGTGLGMSITKKIIDAHKGTIKVKSEEGKGTTVEVALPKTQG